MRSLRFQLLLATTLGTAAVLFVSGVVLYALVSRTLRTEFDTSLLAKARALGALIEFDEDGLESELVAAPLPEFAATGNAECYQIWRKDGSVFARSPSLGSGDLERCTAASGQPVIHTSRLPDGRLARCVQLQVVPNHEPRFREAATAATVTLAEARELSGLESVLARVRVLMLGVGIFAVTLSGAVLAGLVHRNLQPVARLSKQIAAVGECELSARITVDGVPRELSPVVERLNDLLYRLEAAFERERRFTGDVAHELRTPLAGLRAKLELALSSDRSPAAYRAAIRDGLAVNLDMQRLVEQLLHLARADAGQLEFRHQKVAVTALVRDCWDALAERASERGLDIEWRKAPPATVESDEGALRLIMQNILDNAVTYATPGSPISVAVSNQSGTTVLTVSNPSDLAPQDAQRVFERFWQADPARHRQAEARCGLGLPLCRALLARLGGTITADVSTAGVFTVTVRLPGGTT